MNHRSIQHSILAELAPRCASYLEVGVQEGRSLAVVLAAPSITRVLLCDDWGSDSGGTGRGSHAHILPLIAASGTRADVSFLDGDSRRTLPTITRDFDLVHVDGGHSYEVALSDLRNVWPLCNRYLVVHDITFPEVWRAFCNFMATVEAHCTVRCYFGGHGTAVVTLGGEDGAA